MMVSIVNIPTALVFAGALAALFYFKAKLVIPLVVAGAGLAGYVISLVSV
jgi:chromate transporter